MEDDVDDDEEDDDSNATKMANVNVNERSTTLRYKTHGLLYNSSTHACISAIMQQLKYLSITLKTLGVNYLDTIHGAHSAAYGIMVDDTISSILHELLNELQQQVYVSFAGQPIEYIAKKYNDNKDEEEKKEEYKEKENCDRQIKNIMKGQYL